MTMSTADTATLTVFLLTTMYARKTTCEICEIAERMQGMVLLVYTDLGQHQTCAARVSDNQQTQRF